MGKARADLIRDLSLDRVLAHNVLFKHRHPDITPDFHKEIIDLWHSLLQRLIVMAFRGGAKSTIGEEATIIKALLGEFKNGVILGSSATRAVERLGAIVHEITTNKVILDIFGDQTGSQTWSESKVILKNGTVLQAVGRGQSLRGIKHFDQRPDYLLGDDFEDEESSSTKEALEKALKWFISVLMPALDPKKAIIRLVGTPLDVRATLVLLAQDPDWVAKIYPIEYTDFEGNRQATWPNRFPLPEVNKIRDSFARLGMTREFLREYMCKAEDEQQKTFKSSMYRVEPQVRTWQATYAIYDPAKTQGKRSAHTGIAVGSWAQTRLTVWDARGHFFKPDEIINDMFEVNEKFKPVLIGVEQDGLEEFIMQPLRSEMLRRKITLPIKPLRAPKGKISFIEGLQPYFNAHEVIWNQDFPELRDQLNSFPSGKIDVPNALAYLLVIRPGLVVYEDFTMQHIKDEVLLYPGPVIICLNYNGSYSTAIAVQYSGGTLRIIADWIEEGDCLKDIISSAKLEFSQITLCAQPWHWDRYKNTGLLMQCREAGYTVNLGSATIKGQSVIRNLLKTSSHGLPAVQVSARARWVLNGFTSGYARDLDRSNRISEVPVDNIYKIIMEPLESYMGGMYNAEVASEGNYAYDKNGNRYLSARRT